MLVVSDGTPLNILIRIGQVHLLPQMFGTVCVPAAVAEEMTHPSAPVPVRAFVASPPDWFSIRSPRSAVEQSEKHRGERDAISLALELRADAILLDEARARRTATQAGLLVIGTIGILERAADDGLIDDLAAVHARLREGRFHVSEEILPASLDRHRAHKQDPSDRDTVDSN